MRLLKTVDKLILRSYIGPMLASFFIVVFILMMNFVWKYIDEFVGKGLSMWVVIELLFYATNNMIALGFPLAVLFASIMTMGNLGENYELLALKSAGVSLPRVLLSLFFVTIGMAVASFFVTNNLVPWSNNRLYTTMVDIQAQKQRIEFKDGLFFNGIEHVSIRVEHQDPATGLLEGMLIYNTGGSPMTVTVADSGYIRLTDDRHYLATTLYNGENYELTRDRNWHDNNEFNGTAFTVQHSLERTQGYAMERTEENLFGNDASTKTLDELSVEIDSLDRQVNISTAQTYGPLLRDYLFTRDTTVVTDSEEARRSLAERNPVVLLDSIAELPLSEKARVLAAAQRMAGNSRNVAFDETMTKDSLNQLYRRQIEWHKKLSLPVAVIVFFLIGAPLGAIIRKGGLGMPIVISVAFFVLYYVISIVGEKLAKEGSWPAVWGVWMPTLVLLPIALYLTYKATNDSNLLNVEWYIIQYNKLKTWWKKYLTPSKRR